MRFDSTVAPVPRVDRALGALVTLAATAFVAFVAIVLLAPDATTADGLLSIAVAAVVLGATATAWLLLDGYDRFRVPVEGRRWTVELAVFGAIFAAGQALVDAIRLAPAWTVLVAALVALYASSTAGSAVADARDWYDRDAYYRRNDP